MQDESAADCLAVEPTADVLDRVLIEASVKAARDEADVWRGQLTTIRAPSRPKARAVARPMPVSAPVISTVGVFI